MSSEQLTNEINGYHNACDDNNSTEANQRYNNMHHILEEKIYEAQNSSEEKGNDSSSQPSDGK
jgi:hypothetical protein